MINNLKKPNDPQWWGEVRDPEIVRVPREGGNWYEVWMDYGLIDRFKTRAPAKRLVAWLEKEYEDF